VVVHTQRVLSLCTGYGGLELALRMAGVATRPVAYVEREAYAAANLAALMEKGLLDPAPIWDDLATFEARPWRGLVEIVTAGFPCQPFSTAGKRQHLEDERWLWPDIERILRDVVPRAVFLENVPGLTIRGLGPVLGALSDLGLDAEWEVVRANHPAVGAPHIRARVFILAVDPEYRRAHGRSLLADAGCGAVRRDEHGGSCGPGGCGSTGPDEAGAVVADAGNDRRQLSGWPNRDRQKDGANPRGDLSYGRAETVADADGSRFKRHGGPIGAREKIARVDGHGWPPGPGDGPGWLQYIRSGGPKPGVRRGSPGLENRVERCRLLGNGVVPQQAAYAFRRLWERLA
jgi:DNA (cytosine-5)-methyltransferase 1